MSNSNNNNDINNNKRPNDSFLPSGAVDLPPTFNLHDSASPLSGNPPSFPEHDFIPRSHTSTDSSISPRTVMQSRSPPQHRNGPPMSPPKTRSASAENNTATLIEDWREYTQKLRSQFDGEKAHMMADRARMEEVVEEERQLWRQERQYLKARIKQLEAISGSRQGNGTSNPQATAFGASSASLSFASEGSHARSTASSIDSIASSVPQESGRNVDGTPFYAPAPRNPSRTFSSISETSELRVNSITVPRESVIRATTKELRSSDFLQSSSGSQELESIPEMPAETIDISLINPQLEGVPIKASAVSPTFAARVISPKLSPGSSPSILSPKSKLLNLQQGSGTSSPLGRKITSPEEKAAEKEMKTLQVAIQPENVRLTVHAGHTPNHSITKFDEYFAKAVKGSGIALEEVDDNVTPKQNRRLENLHRPSVAPGASNGGHEVEVWTSDLGDNGDRELSGPLGLTNDIATDDIFLRQLQAKLEHAKLSEGCSPSSESGSSITSDGRSTRPRRRARSDEDPIEKDDGPPLRLKPSFNFGRPMGRM